jgi:AAA+ ATPase superfamily predicted ATPase
MEPVASANPFVEQSLIKDADRFVGRQAELAQMLGLLKGMQGVSLVGARRIGKSSLLYHLCQTGNRQLGEEVVIAYTDLRGVTDERSFYECLCKRAGRSGNQLSDLEEAVRDRRVVFGLDQFERVMRSAAFSKSFYDTLRSVASDNHVALLVATEHPLDELFLNEEIGSSVFFGIFRKIELGLFMSDEATDFIRRGFAEAEAEVTENDITRLLELAGRFPCFLAQACFHLFEIKAGRATNWERALRREARPHLESLWLGLKASEHATLRRVLDYQGTPDEEAMEDLARRGLIEMRQDTQGRRGWHLFSHAFEDFVVRPPTMAWRDRPRHWWRQFRRWFKGGEIGAGPMGKITLERSDHKPRAEDKR